MNELQAGWARQELPLPSHWPMAGYIARKGVSQGTNDPLFVRVLVLQQGGVRIAILIADLLLISNTWAHQLQEEISKALHVPVHHVIVAATHTHSGPLVDTAPFHLSDRPTDERTQRYMRVLGKTFAQTAVTASSNLRKVAVSCMRCPIRHLATDRNDPKKNRVQMLSLVRFDAGDNTAVFGVLPCHPTVLGARNRRYSGDLHGEIARRFERHVDVALIGNGATANVSTRFTRSTQNPAQISRFAALVMRQIESRPFMPCSSGKLRIARHTLRIPVRDFLAHTIDYTGRSGRLAEVESEGARVAMQLSKAPEFRKTHVPVTVTLLHLVPFYFAALPLELYAETARFLWSKMKAIPLCYANGYWGYAFAPGARGGDYEVISSPFDSRADGLLREAAVRLARKRRSPGPPR